MTDRFKRVSGNFIETALDSTIRALGKYTFDKGLRAFAGWCADENFTAQKPTIVIGPEESVGKTPIIKFNRKQEAIETLSQRTLAPSKSRDACTDTHNDLNVKDNQPPSQSIRDVGIQTKSVWFYSGGSSLLSENILGEVVVDGRRESSVRSEESPHTGSVGTQIEAWQLAEELMGVEEGLDIVTKLPTLSPDEEVHYEKDSVTFDEADGHVPDVSNVADGTAYDESRDRRNHYDGFGYL